MNLDLISILAIGVMVLGISYYVVYLQKKKYGKENESRYKIIFTVLFFLLMVPILFSFFV